MEIPTFSFAIFLGNSFGITNGLSSFRGHRRNLYLFFYPSKFLLFKLKKPSEVSNGTSTTVLQVCPLQTIIYS